MKLERATVWESWGDGWRNHGSVLSCLLLALGEEAGLGEGSVSAGGGRTPHMPSSPITLAPWKAVWHGTEVSRVSEKD